MSKALLTPLRWLLGIFVRLYERWARVQGIERSATGQSRVDQETAGLALYQFEACPFCVKVRMQMQRLSLKIELRDAKRVAEHKRDLIAGGGQMQVPCLRITGAGPSGGDLWMYESSDINAYLLKRFG